MYVGLALAKKKGSLSQQWRGGVRKFMPDRFWLLNETGVESTDWRSKGAEVGGGESKVWKSSCVEGDRAKAQGSLETCPVMWRNLEPHISVHANWQVGDFCFLHGSSQEQVGRKQVAKRLRCGGGQGGRAGRTPGRGAKEAAQVGRLEQVWAVRTRLPPFPTRSWQDCQQTSPQRQDQGPWKKLLLESQGRNRL